MRDLSVIVPLGPSEKRLGRLLGDLQLLPDNTEVLFVCCVQNSPFSDSERINRVLTHLRIRWIQSATGRAAQLNAGAESATGDVLWFLHADSGFDPKLLKTLFDNLSTHPDSFHFCRLAFMPDGPQKMRINQWGANLRSRCFGVPFGDQGFCINKYLFNRLEGYPLDAPYGEDHLFVWRARQQKIKLVECSQPLMTSARKYRQKGWGALTILYQYLWIKQAAPQWWKCYISPLYDR